jgi:hypothetical protein
MTSVVRPSMLGQAGQYQAATRQALYSSSRGKGYRERYLERKRQDWQFRLGLAQQNLTEEYRQEARYLQMLKDEADSLRGSRDAMRKLQGDLASRTADSSSIDLVFRGHAQNHQMMAYQRTQNRKLEEDLNPKTGTRTSLKGIYEELDRLMMDPAMTSGTFRGEVEKLLTGSGGYRGQTGNILAIGEIEGQGSISHRMSANMLSEYIIGIGSRRGFATSTAWLHPVVEKSMGLPTGSVAGVGTELEVERAAGIEAIKKESPLIDWEDMKEDKEVKDAALKVHADKAGALALKLEQDILDVEAEIDIRGMPEAPGYEDVLREASRIYDEPRDLAGQMQLNKELGQLKASNRALEDLPPEERAVMESFIEGSKRYREKPGSMYTDDEETKRRADEVIDMVRSGALKPDDLYELAKQWGRTRHEMEYEKRHPGAKVSYDPNAQAGYTKDLMAVIGAIMNEQEVAPVEAMTTMTPGEDPEPDPRIEPETTMEVQVPDTEPIPTQTGDFEDDPLLEALKAAEAEEGE